MTNNLKELKQELKSFAKKVTDFRYTDSALITFLLTGVIGRGASANLFSDGSEIENQSKVINTSIAQQKKDFKRARMENEKLIKNKFGINSAYGTRRACCKITLGRMAIWN